MRSNFVVVQVGWILFVTTDELLADTSNKRWALNIFSIQDDDIYALVDARVFDFDMSVDLARLINSWESFPANKARSDAILKAEPPIIAALVALSNRVTDLEEGKNVGVLFEACFQAIHFIQRPKYDTLEVHLRSLEERKTVFRQLKADK